MTGDDIKYLERVLGGYWYDRPEDDQFIACEIVREHAENAGMEAMRKLVGLMNDLRDDQDVPVEGKAAIIRGAVFRYFEDPVGGPLGWLREMIVRLTDEMSRHDAYRS